jgi:putative oxidoreductase
MQRLYSTFPGALPGTGLLILRMAAALSLTASGLLANDHWTGAIIWILAATVGGCFIIGYCTPIAAVAQVASHLWALIYSESLLGTRLVMIALGVSLMLLGPGAWSVDARLYGRRRVNLDTNP